MFYLIEEVLDFTFGWWTAPLAALLVAIYKMVTPTPKTSYEKVYRDKINAAKMQKDTRSFESKYNTTNDFR